MFFADQQRYKYQPASGRLFIDTLDEMHDRFDRKFARLEKDGYRFVANPARERLMARNAAKLLLSQMVKNV